MPWTIDRDNGRILLALGGVVDIFDAAVLHGDLMRLAAEPDPVDIDLRPCQGVDTSTLQLLLALTRNRSSTGLDTRVTATGSHVGRLCARFGLGGAGDGARGAS